MDSNKALKNEWGPVHVSLEFDPDSEIIDGADSNQDRERKSHEMQQAALSIRGGIRFGKTSWLSANHWWTAYLEHFMHFEAKTPDTKYRSDERSYQEVMRIVELLDL
jgi:hypothetical protein